MQALRVPLMILPKPSNAVSSTLLLAYGFAGLILLGTILLILPISTSTGQFTSPVDALFTATSAVCVTGLVVMDTGTYWSTFGQAVLLVLFQLGGLGFIVGTTLLLLAIGGRFGLRDKMLISESLGIEQLGGIGGLILQIAIFSIIIEIIGAVILYSYWVSSGYEISAPLWTAVFHAVSAFNNCGMDLFGNFSSLSHFQGDTLVLLITGILIIFGSTGYLVLIDIIRKRGSLGRLFLDSKMVLLVTLSLLVLGTIFYLIVEYFQPAVLGPMQFPQKILEAFFITVNRTSGFSTVDIASLQQISLFFMMFLMFVGGAAGSVAGGIKVTTFGILMITAINLMRGKENICAFGRQLTKQTIYRATVLCMFYLGFLGIIVLALSATERFPIDNILFEAFSALGTVGLSTGITPDLSTAGRVIVVIAMFCGRLGPLALIAYLVHHREPVDLEHPHESVRMG